MTMTTILQRTTPILALAALAACRGTKADGAAAAAPPPATILRASDIVIVDSSIVERGPVLTGTLRPKQIAVLRAQIGGRVLDVMAEQGQTVRRGATLVMLDPAALRETVLSARAQLHSAEALRDNARRNQERNEKLAVAGALADRDAENSRSATLQADAQVDDAKARLRNAEEQLSYASVRAPFGGVVTEQPVNPGDVVAGGASLMTIVNADLLELEATVPVDALPSLKRGASVTFSSSALPGRLFTGTIDRINPALDVATRQVQLYVNVPNRKNELVAGLFVEGRVAVSKSLALSVPTAALDQRGGSASVLKLQGGRVVRVPVTIALRDEVAEKAAIASGVAKGDSILVGGALTVSPGAQVRVQADQ